MTTTIRRASRRGNLFDLAVGDDNLFNRDRYKWSLRFTVINLTNKVALYNFLSTFSGTHYVTPRTLHGGTGLPLLRPGNFGRSRGSARGMDLLE